MQPYPAVCLAKDRSRRRTGGDPLDCFIKFVTKSIGQSISAFLRVPSPRFDVLAHREPVENDFVRGFVVCQCCSLTCDHGTASASPRSNAATRRSSSATHASSMSCSASGLRLSSKFCTTWARSSSVSRNAASTMSWLAGFTVTLLKKPSPIELLLFYPT